MKYPNKIKKLHHNETNYANRGMTLENDLNLTNNYYLENNIAIIYKKATPIQVVKINYNNKKHPLIKEAYFQTPSTTDYNGVYHGKYIDFEAKETKNKTSFPLTNIHKHQLNHIEKVIEHGGISFIIVRWTTLNETYLLKGETLISYINNKKQKSIPLTFFKKEGYIIKENYQPRLDYLKIIDLIYIGDSNEKNNTLSKK
jgi:recombination protein U